jgi:hypothetical protein
LDWHINNFAGIKKLHAMQKIIFSVILGLYFLGNLFAQNEKKIDVQFHGYVKVDYFYDSRQTVAARAGHFLLFPTKADFDVNGEDINATPMFNILAIQTRVKSVVTGPEILGAKSSALIEAAFFGHTNADINGLRLRHAFMKLNWDNAELLLGQYWHPMFVTGSFPAVYSFNTGAPFQPFSRNPQLRITYGKNVKLIGTFYSQRDFDSKGPNGTSCEYMRNSGVPSMNAQVQFQTGSLFGGAGVDYKLLRPTLAYDGVKYIENLSALSYIGFLKYARDRFQFKVEGTYGENMTDLLMIGGMADYTDNPSDPSFDGYTNFTSMAFWGEVMYSLEKVEFGVFGGYAKNLGIDKPFFQNYYSLDANIASMWRGSVRGAWKKGPVKFGLEFEVTDAQYGTLAPGEMEIDITDVDPVRNYRILVFGMYTF